MTDDVGTDSTPAQLASTWDALLAAFEQAGQDSVWQHRLASTDQDRAEGMRHLLGLVHAGYLMELVNGDPAYPTFASVCSAFYPWAYPNPDCRYDAAPVHGDHTYRVYGRRGGAAVVNAEIYQGRMDDVTTFRTFANRDIPEDIPEDIAEGEEFELVLSREPQDGLWLELPPGPGMVWLRQYFGDWDTEEPGDFYIERDGAVFPPPPDTAQVLNQRLGALARTIESLPRLSVGAAGKHATAPTDRIEFPPLDWGMSGREGDHLGFGAVQYGQAHYELDEGQAAIITVTPPDCAYWQFQLLNAVWTAPNFHYRQLSVNNRQAHLDDDGMFRAVIAHRDPAVPNWLDTEGRHTGLIGGRYYRTDTAPEPVVEVVPFDRIRDHLPAEHPTVTPQARSATLQRRLHAVQRRNRG